MNENEIIITRRYDSPCGSLTLGSYGEKLCLCDWTEGKRHDDISRRLLRTSGSSFGDGRSAVIDDAIVSLEEYFAGKRDVSHVPLMFVGTDFQKRVWQTLLAIPYGDTVSYGEIARRIGMPASVRAVANAIGANGISIFIPCHRVTGSDGRLTGYRGGLAAKEYLLKLEKGF